MGEIMLTSFGFAPQGWALCNGQLLPINQNQALFSLLGTTFGGDGRVNFALPDLRARTPMHSGNGHQQGERAGEQAHTVSAAEMPTHVHFNSAQSGAGTSPIPTANLFGSMGNLYTAPGNLTSLIPSTVTNVGGSQAHLNMQPFLSLNFCIALQGIFPTQN